MYMYHHYLNDIITYLVAVDAKCWSLFMQLNYNDTTKLSSNTHGVDVRVPGFGDTATVERIDPSWTTWLFNDPSAVFAPFVESKNGCYNK